MKIEVPKGASPIVGTGFAVRGLSDRYFVITSTHVILPTRDPEKAPPYGCVPLLAGTQLFEGNSGGRELRPSCAYHIGDEVSLIQLHPRHDGYKVVDLFARDLALNDVVTLAGFLLGGDLETNRHGKVTRTTGQLRFVETDTLTGEGMSGGPYINHRGRVVGIHQAGAKSTAGVAFMTPITFVRAALEGHLPRIGDDKDETPSSAPATNAAKAPPPRLPAIVWSPLPPGSRLANATGSSIPAYASADLNSPERVTIDTQMTLPPANSGEALERTTINGVRWLRFRLRNGFAHVPEKSITLREGSGH